MTSYPLRFSFAVAALLTACGPGRAADLVLNAHIEPRTPGHGRYHYVRFAVPPGTGRITVHCRYDRVGGANVVGLGLFDARAGDVPEPRTGFRGMNPHSQEPAFVALNSASPGFTPGMLYSGTWHAFLDAYQVAPGGVDVAVHVQLTPEQAPQRWYTGDLHMHTFHSDGNWTTPGLIEAATRDKLDFLCITDHNVVSHHAGIDAEAGKHPGLLILRGEEITSDGGHANACGLPSGVAVDARIEAGDNARLAAIASTVHDAGALFAVNHPFAGCPACAWSFDPRFPAMDAVEVWNGPWDATDEKAVALWDAALRAGRRVTAIGATDSHRAGERQLGRPATHLRADALTQASVLDAVRTGRAYITAQPATPLIVFEAAAGGNKAGIGDELALERASNVQLSVQVSGTGEPATVLVISREGRSGTFALDEAQRKLIDARCERDSWFRIEVRNQKGAMLALTNPIYVRVGR